MLPFETRFRRLLRIFIPKLSNADISKHERLIALRHQLIQEREILKNEYLRTIINNGQENPDDPGTIPNISPEQKQLKESIDEIQEKINDTTNSTNKILGPHATDFKRVQELYINRSKKLITDKKYLQLPTSPKEAWQTVKFNAQLHWQQTKMAVLYLPRRIISNKKKSIIGGFLSLAFSVSIIQINFDVEVYYKPITTNIQQIFVNIFVGKEWKDISKSVSNTDTTKTFTIIDSTGKTDSITTTITTTFKPKPPDLTTK